MTPAELASRIDHTILKPEATAAEVDRVLAEAIEHRFASACVAPVWTARAASRLRGTGVHVCTVAAFPHGTSKPIHKAIEASGLVKDGADEVDVVAHLPHLIAADVDATRDELREVARAARAVRRDVVLKVIVESACLMALGPRGPRRRSRPPAARSARAGATSSRPAPASTPPAARRSRPFG